MSVIIKGMEMPKSCERCPFLDYEQGYCFTSGKKGQSGWYEFSLWVGEDKTKRHANRPLKEMPTERRGHWKECKSAIPITMEKLHIADGIMFCSECEHLALQRLVYEDGNGDLKFIKSNYCPNCGARMEGTE